ncbi:2-dehydropantoate 2-reductase [Cryptococcus wingfieldii CBS 7118]|uniref:2-dehydropantoate 2-reductase n=1 Tax=Cryptococcus wingfieldii CBS 7118 TaxID=1295528 RepID=A0A1E3IEU6_9TREE|nr:2-dehydropantoate 2-reductase [Cryptococcus wingfieldii CBS 7118]ODN87113.1 2-dehydropantoate 2-reductase [Cryptococcus wingfieldii CBS 7118]
MSSKPNVLLFGLGGIGGIYASILQLSQRCNVHVVARSSYQEVKENGFAIVSPKFGDHTGMKFAGVWKSTDEAAASGAEFSYILCASKALLDASPSLSDHLRPILNPSTSVVLLQNGVGAEAPLHKSFPDNTIISAVVWTGGKTLSDNSGVEQFNREGLTIGVDYRKGGDKTEEDAKLKTLVDWLAAGKGDCTLSGTAAAPAATLLKTGPFFASSDLALPLCYSIMNEVAAVAKAKGLTVPEGKVEELIKTCTDVEYPGLPSSMMADVKAGRPSEVGVILGVPVREGIRLGVSVPTITTLYTLIKAIDYRNQDSDAAGA